MSAQTASLTRPQEDSQVDFVTAEDHLRAQVHGLLASVLAAPPNGGALATLAALEGDDTPLGAALNVLAQAARRLDKDAVEAEYNRLFIGLGRGEVVPYASFHLTGFLHEKPLAQLRRDMAQLGIAPADDVSEPEDHIASLLWMMAGLIEGDFGEPASLQGQRNFFETHIEPWAGRFFTEIENAQGADLYRPVGSIGRLFMDIETKAFAMS